MASISSWQLGVLGDKARFVSKDASMSGPVPDQDVQIRSSLQWQDPMVLSFLGLFDPVRHFSTAELAADDLSDLFKVPIRFVYCLELRSHQAACSVVSLPLLRIQRPFPTRAPPQNIPKHPKTNRPPPTPVTTKPCFWPSKLQATRFRPCSGGP